MQNFVKITSFTIKQLNITSTTNLVIKRDLSDTKAPPKLPELFYLPKITEWIKTKMKLKYLKKFWDPEFTEGKYN